MECIAGFILFEKTLKLCLSLFLVALPHNFQSRSDFYQLSQTLNHMTSKASVQRNLGGCLVTCIVNGCLFTNKNWHMSISVSEPLQLLTNASLWSY